MKSAAQQRIVFVNRYFFPDESATSQLLSDLAFGLSKQGYEVHVVCSRQRYDAPDCHLPAHERIEGVIVHRLWTTRFGRRRLRGRAMDYLSFHASCALRLSGLLRRGDVVVAETDPPLIGIVAMAAARLRRARLINWLQDVFPEVATHLGASPLPAAIDAALRGIRNRSLRAAACNVVLGQRMQEYLIAQGVPAQKIRIIENWALAEGRQPLPTAGSLLRARLGLQQNFVVGYSGNLGRAHEYTTLLGAAELLRDDPGIVFLMVGGGVNMEALRVGAAERQLGNVRFLPYQPRESLGDSLAAPDVHLVSLMPALEGLIVPSKFYGILAAERPVIFIGDSDGELARIIRGSGCGLVVPMQQAARLVEAIRHCQSNRDDARRMGQSAFQLLQERYSAARAQTSWLSLLAATPAGHVADA